MESPKKQTPPSWDEIVRGSRKESPPALDVRPQVRARIEVELRSRAQALGDLPLGLLDSVLELFSKPFAGFSLGASLGAVACLAVVATSTVEFSELVEEELDLVDHFDEALLAADWDEYL